MTDGSQLKRVAGAVVLAACSAAMAGPDWVETGDAGSTVATAQKPTGIVGAPIHSIAGVLQGGSFVGDYEDCYIIRITDPANFTMQAVGANFNAKLYLFNITVAGGGYGLLANDDQAVGNNLPKLGSLSNDGTNVHVTLPGDYMIAITGFNHVPDSLTGNIFSHETLTEISGPDGPGGFNALTGWSGTGQTGTYNITFTGAGFPQFPAPGSLGLMVLGGLAAARRKR